MKYWKGKPGTIKENQYGTMDEDGYVPDSITISRFHYTEYINSLPELEPIPESDINNLIKYAKQQKWIN